jgi:hypothetical protein
VINEKSFEIPYSYSSIISDKFRSLDKTRNTFICSIPQQHLSCFESFFSLFKGSSFYFDEFDLSSLIYLIDYFDLKSLLHLLENSLSFPSNIQESISFLSRTNCQLLEKHFQKSLDILIENIEDITIDQFLQIPNENLLLLFSSSHLSIQDEDFLFNLIVRLIEQDISRKTLLQTVYFPLVSSILLKNFFQNLPIEEIDLDLFESIKQRLFCDVIFSDSLPTSTRWKKQPILVTKSEIEEISEIMNNHFHKSVKLVESTQELILRIQSQEQLISSLQKENQEIN